MTAAPVLPLGVPENLKQPESLHIKVFRTLSLPVFVWAWNLFHQITAKAWAENY
jgi:hypothetical protein